MGASIIHRASDQARKLLGYVDFVPGALTRLVAGFAFYDSGKGKLENMENTVDFFTGLGIPFPEANAAFVARLEYYGGMLLLLCALGVESDNGANKVEVYARGRRKFPPPYCNSFTRCPPRSAARTNARSKTSVWWSIPSVQM